MTEEQVCNSCKRTITNVTGTVTFHCPSCKEKITRCGHCRSIGAKFASACGFTGPN